MQLTLDRTASAFMEEEKRGYGVLAGEEEDDDVFMFPGFRFHPTDEELVGFYLRRKVAKKALSVDQIIRQVDIYKYDPWDLPKASHFGGEREWYFFCLRGRKYRNSIRPNRVTGSGFWKATGIDRPIYSSPAISAAAAAAVRDCIGLKKSLVYYRGSAGKGTKTDWMMHEFRLPSSGNSSEMPPSIQEAEIWTICRIFKRSATYHKKHPHHSHHQLHLKQSICNANSNGQFDHHSISNSFESDTRDHVECRSLPGPCSSRCSAGEVLNRPFLELDAQAAAAAAAAQTPAAAAASGTSFMDEVIFWDGADSGWDELGRIMELMTDAGAGSSPVFRS